MKKITNYDPATGQVTTRELEDFEVEFRMASYNDQLEMYRMTRLYERALRRELNNALNEIDELRTRVEFWQDQATAYKSASVRAEREYVERCL